jgi:uncharacterized GH25 family protein
MRFARPFVLALLANASAGAARLTAHDFWIEPSTFHPAVGSTVGARLMVGQGFRGDPLPRNPALIAKFVLAAESGETAVIGRSGDEPAGTAAIASPGLQWLGYRSSNSFVTLEPKKFEDYLREEGLESIVAERARRGESEKPSRELFSRCAKALLSPPGASGAGFDRALGFTLELIPEKNPDALRAGEELPVRLLFEGKPLEGALVVALPYEHPDQKLSQRTDAKGRARLRLPQGGVWLVKAVHMVAAPAAEASRADWQSLWASLTFEIPSGSPVGRAP